MENCNTFYQMKVISEIKDVPNEWQITNDWNSHLPALWLSFKNTNGKVAEFGSGEGSTELLRSNCVNLFRDFVSLENNKEWAVKTKALFIEDYERLENAFELVADAGLVFVDSAPASTRENLIRLFENKNTVIVVHDTEEVSNYVYGLKNVLSAFKYRVDYRPEGLPHTTIVSNTENVENWI